MYSSQLLDHFEHPRNAGDLVDASARTRVENPVCGDVLELSVRVNSGRVSEIRFRAKGCVPAMACGSLITVMASGKTEAEAGAIEAVPRRLFGGGTSISGAIDYARLLLMRTPVTPARRVIDVSGDGSNNSGRPVTAARDEAVRAGIGINGLPILSIEPDLDDYYRDYVIGGPGAFMVPAASFETFGEAILKKLITEIAAGGARGSVL